MPVPPAPSPASSPVSVSIFARHDAPQATQVLESDWRTFADQFKKALPPEIPKSELPLWSPAVFAEGRRNKAHVERVHAITLDVDETPVPDRATLETELAGIRSVVHSSSRATAQTSRWRAALALSRPVTADEYERLWTIITSQLSFRVGQQAKDPSRAWYVPRAGDDGYYECFTVEGEPLDVDALLSTAPAQPQTLREPSGNRSGTSDAHRAPRRQLAAEMLGKAWASPGNRHAAQLALAGALCRDGWLEANAVEFLCAVCRVAGDEDRPKRTATVRGTYARAANGANTLGWNTLGKYVDPSVVGAARKLLDLHADDALVLGSDSAEPAKPVESGRRLTAAERARRVGDGSFVRLKTGMPSVDSATRGGILQRKVVAIGGAPGAGKTATVVQMAYRWLSEGVCVGFLAYDEDAESILIRFGQLSGLSRDLLERGDAGERERLAQWCDRVPLLLIDGDENETLEGASEDLKAAAEGRPSVLFVDSIQTVRTRETPPKGSDVRARVGVVVRALKCAAKVDGHVVVATSEISKSAYRNKDAADNINALSAFKESGDIEYGVGLALVLTSRTGCPDVVDAVVAKNRLGQGKPELVLRLNENASVEEIDPDTVAALDPAALVREDVLRVVDEAHGAPLTASTVYERVGGRKKTVLDAIRGLSEERTLIQDRRGGLRRPLPGEAGV